MRTANPSATFDPFERIEGLAVFSDSPIPLFRKADLLGQPFFMRFIASCI